MALDYNFNMVFPKVNVINDPDNEFHKTFEIEPLEKGFGLTVGNAIRRIGLSSLPGGAVKQISIKGVAHEYDVFPTIVEDITTVVLAIKNLHLKIDEQDKDYVLTLRGNKAGILTGADIECPAGVEVTNPDLKIVTLASDEDFYMELIASKGLGYVLAETHRGKEKKANTIFVDSNYTPVQNIHYAVEDTRVGDMTNYDKLILDITTNGTVSPEDAFIYSSHILKTHMTVFEELDTSVESSEVFEDPTQIVEGTLEVDNDNETSTSIEILEISNRAYNGLKRANINTIEELCTKTKKAIAALDNIGAKTVDEIEKQLEELGYSLQQQ